LAGVGDCRLSEGGPMDRLAKLFVLNRAGLNVKRGAVVFGGMLVPFVVLTALDQQQYFLAAVFATLFAAMCDPGGEYRTRVQMMAGMAVAGALLTGLGFAVGARGWGLVVLAAFVADDRAIDRADHAGLAHVGHMRVIHQRRQPLGHVGREALVGLEHRAVEEDAQRGTRRSAAQRIAGVAV